MNVQAVAAEEKAARAGAHSCRLCGGHVEHTFVDLGMSPLCESFLLADQLDRNGAVFSAARRRLRRLLPRTAEGVRPARAHLQRIRVLLVLFDVMGRPRARPTAR